MRKIFILASLVACLTAAILQSAKARTPVAIELVLAVDSSFSVNDQEYTLQMKGLAAAFRSREVIETILAHDGVAVALLQWAGWPAAAETVRWKLLYDEASIISFAAEIETTPRLNLGYHTAIGSVIDAGLQALANNAYAGRRLKIDISGDGRNNAGPALAQSRAHAVSLGVTINGLAIDKSGSELMAYYRRHVMAGPDAFVIAASGYKDFARAIYLKLLRELAPAISLDKPPPHRFTKPAAPPPSIRRSRAALMPW